MGYDFSHRGDNASLWDAEADSLRECFIERSGYWRLEDWQRLHHEPETCESAARIFARDMALIYEYDDAQRVNELWAELEANEYATVTPDASIHTRRVEVAAFGYELAKSEALYELETGTEWALDHFADLTFNREVDRFEAAGVSRDQAYEQAEAKAKRVWDSPTVE